MTEYKCGNCKEVLILSPRARLCPECGSTSLNMIIKELAEPAQRETIGVYSPSPTFSELVQHVPIPEDIPEPDADEAQPIVKEEEDQPRRRRR